MSSAISAAAGSAALLAVALGCGGGGDGSGGGSSPTMAATSISVKGGTVPDPTVDCTASITFTATPGSLTGSEGRTTELVVDKSFDDSPTLTSGGDWTCFFDDFTSVTGLAVGTWTVRAQTATWAAECTESLRAGTNLIHFTINRNGCVAGVGYPGD